MKSWPSLLELPYYAEQRSGHIREKEPHKRCSLHIASRHNVGKIQHARLYTRTARLLTAGNIADSAV